jgi:hypothetical protein
VTGGADPEDLQVDAARVGDGPLVVLAGVRDAARSPFGVWMRSGSRPSGSTTSVVMTER